MSIALYNNYERDEEAMVLEIANWWHFTDDGVLATLHFPVCW